MATKAPKKEAVTLFEIPKDVYQKLKELDFPHLVFTDNKYYITTKE